MQTSFIKPLLILAGLMLTNVANAANLIASVDRNQITINETLRFQLEYDSRAATDQLDLTALRKEFDILNLRPNSSSSVSIINGKTSQKVLTSWTMTLAPLRKGTLVIPSFNVGAEVSNAIRIEVTDASVGASQDQPILVRLSTDFDSAHIGQQILVNIELLAKSNVSNLSGDQLRLDNAQVELLDQQSFRRVENGISWQVVEWSYAVFPEQTGILAIPAQLFSGSVPTTTQRNRYDPFQQQRGQRVAARSSATAISIEAVPETNGVPWFPANKVDIKSIWQGDTTQMRVGEPLTRTIEISAAGQRASVIPPLPENSSVIYKAYKDQPQLDNQLSSNSLIGIRRESEAIVPSAEGVLELPEQRISWWNSASKSWQQAVLPAETFDVLPALQGSSFAPPTAAPQFLADQAGTNTLIVEATSIWWQIATLALAVLCAAQFWLLSKRRHNGATANTETDTRPSDGKAWKLLQKTLVSGNAHDIRSALLSWSHISIPDQRIPSLGSLADSIDYEGADNLRAQLSKLDASLYKDDTNIDIAALTEAIEQLKRALAHRPEKEAGLAPLYPK